MIARLMLVALQALTLSKLAMSAALVRLAAGRARRLARGASTQQPDAQEVHAFEIVPAMGTDIPGVQR